MRILILTGRFGMGHYSASDAVKQEIEKTYPDANINIIDIVNYLVPELSETIYEGFNILTSRLSSLYNSLNKIADKYNSMPLKGLVSKKLDKLFEEYSPEIVISTLPMSSQYISEYKKIRKLDIPLYTCITDVTTHDEWLAENTDMYFVASKGIKEKLILKGIDRDKIKIIGIPVKQKFKDDEGKDCIQENKELLIMGGGLGIIPHASQLLNQLDAILTVNTTVIVGKNRKLYKKINRKYSHIKVVGFTDKVDEYMKKADLIITKAGGITTFEAIYSETPMYIIKPFLAQEIKNVQYIESENLGKVVWEREKDIAYDVLMLLNNKETLQEIKNNMKRVKEEIGETSIASEIGIEEKGA